MEVHIDDEYQYAVVQFLELPRSNIDDYVCVPHSWIRMRRAKDRKTTVAFPDEPRLLTDIRIKNGERPLETWNTYMAVIKYETYSYIDANYYIVEKKTITSIQNKHSAMRSDHTSLSDTATNNISVSFKRIKLSESQSKPNEKITQVMSKTKFIDQFPKMNQSPGYANLKSETPASNLLKKMNETQVSRFRTGTQSPNRTILYAPRNVLNLKKEILRNFPEINEDFSSLFRGRSQNDGPVEEEPKRNLLNQQARIPEISIPQHQVQDLGANTSVLIQNPTNVSNQSHQTRKSPVNQYHPQALPTQMTPGRTSEMEFTYQTPTGFNSADHQDSSTQAMIVDEPTEVSCNEQAAQTERSTETESFASINSRENVGQSCQSVAMEEEKTTTDQVSSTEETDTEDLETDGNFVDEADQPADSITNIRDRWRRQLADIFTEMDCDFSHACEVTSELHQSFVRSATAIKRIKNIYKNFRNEKVEEASAVTPKDVTVSEKETAVEDRNESNQAEKKKEGRPDEDMNEDDGKCRDDKAKSSEDDDDDDDGDGDNDSGDERSKNIEDDEEKETPKKIRGYIRAFVLPAEYDPKDTKWTLKNRENNSKLGLVELMPRTKVYINSIKLAHCKRVAKDSKTLARMLLVEIFSQNALSVCSLTGARANAFDISGTRVRPGLDEHARMVILNFVEDHARQKNWGVFDSQSVINSIRSKIQEMRAKYGQTE